MPCRRIEVKSFLGADRRGSCVVEARFDFAIQKVILTERQEKIMKLSPARLKQHHFLQRLLDVANGRDRFSSSDDAYQAMVLARALPRDACASLRSTCEEYLRQHNLPPLSPVDVVLTFDMDLSDLHQQLYDMACKENNHEH